MRKIKFVGWKTNSLKVILGDAFLSYFEKVISFQDFVDLTVITSHWFWFNSGLILMGSGLTLVPFLSSPRFTLKF